MRTFLECENQTEAKKNIVEAVKKVAERLGNTPSVCRKCYIHPAVLDCYMSGDLVQVLETAEKKMTKNQHSLREEEEQLMFLLERRLKAAA